MKVIILAGWTGTRLWPVSTKAMPKQFLKIDGEESMLQMTYERVRPLVENNTDILISTNEMYAQMIKDDLAEFDISDQQIIIEPAKRNTTAAIWLAVSYIKDILGWSDDEVVLIVPADHFISPNQTFLAYAKGATEVASKWNIVTFGIDPSYPETWYGYIQVDPTSVSDFSQKVLQFVEKPDQETAKKYLNSWNYYRNSWIFMFSVWIILQEMKQYIPSIWELANWTYQAYYDAYEDIQNIAIDVAVMEQTDHIHVVPMHIKRTDVWSRDSMYGVLEKDEHENAIIGDVKIDNVSGSMIRATSTKIKVNDINNIIVIEDDDGIYITKKWKSQWVKNLL